MQSQRHSAIHLAALAVGLLSCQIVQPETALPPVGAPPPGLAEFEGVAEPEALQALDAVEARLLARAGSLSPGEITDLSVALRDAAERYGLSPGLVLAVIEVESQFDAFAVSPVGAMGLMQIRPRTGEALARRHDEAWYGPHTLFDPVVNVRLGIAYLAELQHRFGHWPTALAAYNWGPTVIRRRLHAGEPIPAGYAQRVLATQERRAESEAQTS